MADNITFYQGSQADYRALKNKDANGIYFLNPEGTETIGQIYKGNVKYGASELTVASGTSLGGIKIGSDFDIASDGTLSLYVPININSFSNDKSSNEIGSSVTSATFSWNVNKMPTQLTLTSGTLTQTLANSQVNNTLVSFANGLTSNTTFTLQATDSRNKPVSKTCSINFYHKKYYGVSTVSDTSGVTDAFVRGLTGVLASSRAGSFTVNAGANQYIWFAIPASWGTPQMYVGGFEGGFSLIRTFDFTNASGNKTSYNVYRSTNANLGNTTVEVR